jgi:hypothetical protein
MPLASAGFAHRLAVEAQDVAQHAPERRARQVPALAEHRAEIGAGPFQVGLIQPHAERHVAGDGFHAQHVEQPGELGIGAVVEHQKAGVDRKGLAVERHVHRVRVAAQAVFRLEQRDLMPAAQQPGGRQARNPRSDDSDAHLAALLSGSGAGP